ncbi:membrane protein [Tenuifilaceae bacterium CYCD]|nr:membrane protein [Tenuifilaceae bacterium CYCD]
MEKIENSPKINPTRVIIGVLLIALAGLILIDNFNFYCIPWNHYIFTWQTLLIVIGLILVAKHESKTFGLSLIAVGAFFLIAKYYDFPVSFRRLFWPAILLVLGFSLIFSRHGKYKNKSFNKFESKDDYIDDLSVFGGSEQRINSQNFQGGRITNVFGGSTIDLSEAKLAPGVNYIEILCIFGGSKLLIPSDWKVKIDVVSIFGGISDKRKLSAQSDTQSSPELVIKGLVLFGGADIKSF